MKIIVLLLLCICMCISATSAEEQVKGSSVVVSSKVNQEAKTRTDQALIVASVMVEDVDREHVTQESDKHMSGSDALGIADSQLHEIL